MSVARRRCRRVDFPDNTMAMWAGFIFLLFIQSVVGTNFAFEKLAFIGGGSGTNPQVVVDNDPDSCQLITEGVGAYFTVDLKQLVRVERFQIKISQTTGVQITANVLQIDPFITPRSPCTCKDSVSLVRTTSTTMFDCDTKCSGRYIYLQFNNHQYTFWLCDVQVFGTLNDSLRTESVYQLHSTHTIKVPSQDVSAHTPIECAMKCSSMEYCIGFNYKRTSTTRNCGLVDRTQGPAMTFRPEEWVYYYFSDAKYLLSV